MGEREAFAVQKHGHGPAVILIPGLTCGGEVWDETVRRLQDRYELHVLTLSGFAGRPARPGPLLPRVRAELDPPTVGKAMYEMLVRDIRNDVAAIESPVLLFGPGVGTPQQRARVEEIYLGQVATIPDHEVVFAEGARHFVMLDARDLFARHLDAFLAAHRPGGDA